MVFSSWVDIPGINAWKPATERGVAQGGVIPASPVSLLDVAEEQHHRITRFTVGGERHAPGPMPVINVTLLRIRDVRTHTDAGILGMLETWSGQEGITP